MARSRRFIRPTWWDWELEISSHAHKRMLDRRFTEADIRTMMASALSLREGDDPGRWVVEARFESRPWEVVLELDPEERLLVVVTAYPVSSP